MKLDHQFSCTCGFDFPLTDDGARAAGHEQRPGQPDHAFARARIVRCVTAAIDAPFEQGAQVEAEAFLECLASPEREQLVAQFFAARAARKSPNG